jgi:hypothetical protein
MARSDTRYSIYPAPKAVEVVGNTSPALNLAIECWAALLVRAMADNSKSISPANPTGTLAPDELHFLHEWCVLAAALKGKRFDPDFANPGDLLATAVEDAHRLENIGEEWFQSETDGEMREAGLRSCITELVKKLHGLDYAHAWAVIVTVQWFWEQNDGIDIRKDPWWTLTFRRQWKGGQARKQSSGKADAQHPGTAGRQRKRQETSKRAAGMEDR